MQPGAPSAAVADIRLDLRNERPHPVGDDNDGQEACAISALASTIGQMWLATLSLQQQQLAQLHRLAELARAQNPS